MKSRLNNKKGIKWKTFGYIGLIIVAIVVVALFAYAARTRTHVKEEGFATVIGNYMETQGIDYPGNDISSKKATVDECKQWCDSTPACKMYVTNGAGDYCWIKSKVGTKVTNNDRNSYIQMSPPIPNRNYTERSGIDYPGNDISSKKTSAAECKIWCDSTPGCAMYVTNGAGDYCWIKNNVGTPVSNSDRVSYLLEPTKVNISTTSNIPSQPQPALPPPPPPPPPDPMTQVLSSRELYRDPCPTLDKLKATDTQILEQCNFDRKLKLNRQDLIDRDDLLIMNGCKEITDNDLKAAGIQPTSSHHVIGRYPDVINKIVDVLKNMQQQRNSLLTGPIYVLIMQVPVHPVDESTWYSTLHSVYEPVKQLPNDKTSFDIHIVEPLNQLQEHKKAAMCSAAKLFHGMVNNDLCFVRCTGDLDTETNYYSYCGCNSQGGKCITRHGDKNKSYGVLYKINEMNVVVKPLFYKTVV